MKKIDRAYKLAKEYAENPTFESYKKVSRVCEDLGLFFCETTDDDGNEQIVIEDDRWTVRR